MKLSARVNIASDREPFIALIEDGDGQWKAPLEKRSVISASRSPDDEVSCIFAPADGPCPPGSIALPSELGYLGVGDIVRVNPRAGEIRVLYRRKSRHNSLLVTERCNSRCVMCSQPPREIDDGYLVDELIEAIPLMSVETPELGITGGEPTLLGSRLIDLIASAKRHLPQTALHVLSNGRTFRFLQFARQVADAGHSDLMFGIPLYADTASRHDYVVQSHGAFDETTLGILNLGRTNVRVEIRVVIHRETYARLPQLARFIVRNFPFVDHVALMGLELMGFARTNLEALWIDPVSYRDELDAAVSELDSGGLRVSIYNHPLCLLRSELWPFARQSISDWKNMFLPQCDSCSGRGECCGFFASSALRMSDHIHPLAGLGSAEEVRGTIVAQ